MGVAVAVILLAGCAAPPVEEGRREASKPAVPEMPPRPPPSTPRPIPQASWTFQQTEAECVAKAVGTGVAVLIAVSRDAPIRLNVSMRSLPPRGQANVPLRFAGEAGNWQLTAHPASAREVAADLGTGDMALSRVLSLLGGGTLEVGGQRLAIVPSDSRGQQWFDCAKRQIF